MTNLARHAVYAPPLPCYRGNDGPGLHPRPRPNRQPAEPCLATYTEWERLSLWMIFQQLKFSTGPLFGTVNRSENCIQINGRRARAAQAGQNLIGKRPRLRVS